LNDCAAKLLITADGTFRRGNRIDLKSVAMPQPAQSPSVERMLVVGRLSELAPQASWMEGRDRWWSTEMADPELSL
jgi:acetyl-CoA synthetase